MTVLITLTTVGADSGPTYNLYSSPDGTTFTPFATGITKLALLAGYPDTVPDGTTTIRVTSIGTLCTNSKDLTVGVVPTCSVPEVTIGTQIWSGCNLDTSTYSDGTPILDASSYTGQEWADLTIGAWCYYNNDPLNGNTYGKLYNWYAVAGIWNEASKTDASQRKNLAATGYHIPSVTEWTALITSLGGGSVAGGKMKTTGTLEAGTGLWRTPNQGATNLSGFTGLPAGYRYTTGGIYTIGEFVTLHDNGQWWSSSESSLTEALYSNLYYLSDAATNNLNAPKANGRSVRCLKGTTTTTTTTVGPTTTTTTTPAPEVFTHGLQQSSSYCVGGVCNLNGTINNITVYSLDETLVAGSYIYTNPELTIPYTTNLVSDGQYIFNVSSLGQLSITCTIDLEC